MTTISGDAVFRTSDPKTRYTLMAHDARLLYEQESFTSCALLVLCYLDALASPGLNSEPARFAAFVKANFADLHAGLDGCVAGKSGGELLYDRYRNGLVHGLGPKSGFALCRNDELGGAYVGEVDVSGLGRYIGINVDRLVDDFLRLVEAKAA